MKILSFDVSSKSTGWSLLDHNENLILFDVIQPPKLELQFKLYWFYIHVNGLFSILKPDVVIVEETYLKNVKTLKVLSQFIGIVNLLCAVYNTAVVFVSPNTVRSAFKIKTKEDVFSFVRNKYKVKLRSLSFDSGNDITDSIILALYYISIVNGDDKNE